MKNYLRKNKGITLVALVITIIVMLILVAVTINFVIDENGIINRSKEARDSTIAAQNDENYFYDEVDILTDQIVISENGFNNEFGVNVPKIVKGMIPVYYENGEWKKADKNNEGNQWYNYNEKKWANIVTVADENSELREAAIGTTIPMDKITTFFVWIPRYAYSITSGYQQGNTDTGEIEVKFLKGNTNKSIDSTEEYPTNYDETLLNPGDSTPMIVHPGFSFGSYQLTGIWVAKFEASGTNTAGQAVGNASSSSSAEQYPPDESTFVKILPSKISWRHISIGESQYQCMKMSENTTKYGWNSSVNSHLIKNSEWGAVAYLCYSNYGTVPRINGAATAGNMYWYDGYTGAEPSSSTSEGWYSTFTESTNGYNTTLGMLASTTGNVYGIYDMNGGAWERVAGYLDNGHNYLNTYGKNNNESVKYFENGALNTQYLDYWDRYDVGEEEKNNQIKINETEILTQNQLWDSRKIEEKYQVARKRITDATYDLMAKHKGIGVNEMANLHSFYGAYKSGETYGMGWYKTTTQTGYAESWSRDGLLIGHGACPFVVRGGVYGSGANAGVLCSGIAYGSANSDDGFRPALGF